MAGSQVTAVDFNQIESVDTVEQVTELSFQEKKVGCVCGLVIKLKTISPHFFHAARKVRYVISEDIFT